MPTTINWKPGVDLPRGRAVANYYNYTQDNMTLAPIACDLRGRNYADPRMYIGLNGNTKRVYSYKTDCFGPWQYNATVVGGNTFGASNSGSLFEFVPSQGPSGTLTTGNTTTKIVLSTALPASVVANQLANRGDGLGYIIRIIGNSAGGSGKTEERRIIGNTAGTTPTIILDEPLTFTPASGDRYEMLSGRLYCLGSSTFTLGNFRWLCVATQAISSSLSNTNAPATITTGNYQRMLPLDESYVPYNRNPGEGFLVGAATYDAGSANWVKSCLTATATALGTITGQASAGDASVLANEYRNFQIRIVEDTGTPTAVGQRRRITSHTAGVSAVYTLASNWTVTPSATAKFVIENDNDKMLFWNNNSTITYNWNHAAGTWDTTTWAARTTASTGGMLQQSFGIVPDPDKNARHSFIFSARGNNTTLYDIFDIAGGATGAWTNGLDWLGIGIQSNRSSWAYVPWTQEGRYVYYQESMSMSQLDNAYNKASIYRYDLKNRVFESWTEALFPSSGTGTLMYGGSAYYYDAGTYIPSVYFFRHGHQYQLCQYTILS